MNDQDYIKLARKCGLDDAITMLYKDELIAFAKEVGAQVVAEYKQKVIIEEKFKHRRNTGATADFDLPAPNDDFNDR